MLVGVLTALGLAILLMVETENRIAQSERFSAQALYAAEAGARQVTRWFDSPGSTSNLVNPSPAAIERSLRLIDEDGDPNTPPLAADGTSSKPYYKQGVDLDANGVDDIFATPYRGSLVNTLVGTEAGPDLRIDENGSSNAQALLASMSNALLPNYPGVGGVQARISRVDVYGPPRVRSGGSWGRFGMATIKVTAKLTQASADGAVKTLAERMVKVVLNELDYNPGHGMNPLVSCENLDTTGSFLVHWGVTKAVGNANLVNNHTNRLVGEARVYDADEAVDLLYGWNFDSDFAAYKAALEGWFVEDPWARYRFGGALSGAPNGAVQPWPFPWAGGTTPLGDGTQPRHQGSNDGTHSNIFQNTGAGTSCPDFNYAYWKSVATSRGNGAHYYVWAGGTTFRENGVGTAREFRDITDSTTGEAGFFFFDTTDGNPPTDTNGDGLDDNLTPAIQLSGGRYQARGMIYLNAASFRTTGLTGRPATFTAPGEPFQDKNKNGRHDAGENWINLDYPTTLGGSFRAKANDGRQDTGGNGAPMRNKRGPSFTTDAVLWGIFFTSGAFEAQGNAPYFGSVIAKRAVNMSAGTADIYWDDSIKTSWPPPGWNLPRVAITRWETDS